MVRTRRNVGDLSGLSIRALFYDVQAYWHASCFVECGLRFLGLGKLSIEGLQGWGLLSEVAQEMVKTEGPFVVVLPHEASAIAEDAQIERNEEKVLRRTWSSALTQYVEKPHILQAIAKQQKEDARAVKKELLAAKLVAKAAKVAAKAEQAAAKIIALAAKAAAKAALLAALADAGEEAPGDAVPAAPVVHAKASVKATKAVAATAAAAKAAAKKSAAAALKCGGSEQEGRRPSCHERRR